MKINLRAIYIIMCLCMTSVSAMAQKFYNLTSQEARKAYMEGIHVGFARRICTDASSKPLPIATYCLRTFHRLGTNPTGKTALHLPWSDFRAGFGAEDAGIQEYSKAHQPVGN